MFKMWPVILVSPLSLTIATFPVLQLVSERQNVTHDTEHLKGLLLTFL